MGLGYVPPPNRGSGNLSTCPWALDAGTGGTTERSVDPAMRSTTLGQTQATYADRGAYARNPINHSGPALQSHPVRVRAPGAMSPYVTRDSAAELIAPPAQAAEGQTSTSTLSSAGPIGVSAGLATGLATPVNAGPEVGYAEAGYDGYGYASRPQSATTTRHVRGPTSGHFDETGGGNRQFSAAKKEHFANVNTTVNLGFGPAMQMPQTRRLRSAQGPRDNAYTDFRPSVKQSTQKYASDPDADAIRPCRKAVVRHPNGPQGPLANPLLGDEQQAAARRPMKGLGTANPAVSQSGAGRSPRRMERRHGRETEHHEAHPALPSRRHGDLMQASPSKGNPPMAVTAHNLGFTKVTKLEFD